MVHPIICRQLGRLWWTSHECCWEIRKSFPKGWEDTNPHKKNDCLNIVRNELAYTVPSLCFPLFISMAISSFFWDSDPSVSRRCWWQWTRRSRSRFHIPSAWVPWSVGVDRSGWTATNVSKFRTLLLEVPGQNGNNPRGERTGGVSLKSLDI